MTYLLAILISLGSWRTWWATTSFKTDSRSSTRFVIYCGGFKN